MIALLITVQSITQMTYIPRRAILFNSINNNNNAQDINFNQLFPCVVVALPI
jgi:hypothetical protein